MSPTRGWSGGGNSEESGRVRSGGVSSGGVALVPTGELAVGRIHDAFTDWLHADDWSFQENPEKSYVVFSFQGQHALWQCVGQAREAQHQFVFYCVAAVKAPEPARSEVAEFLTRANYGLVVGNFELDFSDGDIRYKTSFQAEGLTDLPPLFRSCVYAGVYTADKYFPGLTAVMYGGSTPEQAVQLVEGE